jgi:hypothetical protein
MSVSPVSSTGSAYSSATQSTQVSAFKQRKQDFEALSQALSAGDLAGAQSAFSALQQDLANIGQGQATPPAGQTSQTGQGSFSSALQALGQALSSGDLSGAQSAFAQLQQDIQKVAQGHHHHHHPQGGSTASGSSATSSTTTGTGASQPSSISTTA